MFSINLIGSSTHPISQATFGVVLADVYRLEFSSIGKLL